MTLEATVELDVGTVKYIAHTGKVMSVNGVAPRDRIHYLQALCDDPMETRFEMLPYNGVTYMPGPGIGE